MTKKTDQGQISQEHRKPNMSKLKWTETREMCRYKKVKNNKSLVPFCTSRSSTSSNSFSWTAGGRSSISARHKNKALCSPPHYNLMVRCTEGNRTPTVMTHRGDVLCYSIHLLTFGQWRTVNTSSVQHVVFLCVLNCGHIKPEHWWLFSGSIVNGTGFVWKRER